MAFLSQLERLIQEAWVRFSNEKKKIANKGDYIDGIFPISLGNIKYIHKGLTRIRGTDTNWKLLESSLHSITTFQI